MKFPKKLSDRTLFNGDVVFKYVTLACCCAGMLRQSSDFLAGYFKHPTLMSVLEERESAEFPAVSICLSPWYNLSMVCEKLPTRCSKKDLYVFLKYPKHGFNREYREAGLSDPTVLFKCNLTSFLTECADFDCHDIFRHIYYKVPMMACYTLDLNRFLPRNHSFFNCPHTWSYELSVEARWSPTTTMSSMDMQHYPIFVHESTVYPPESLATASMQKGLLSQYTMTQQKWFRLKKPYRTDCWNYRELYGRREEAVFQGWMNQLSCEQKCRMIQEAKHCGCVKSLNEFSHFAEWRICDFTEDEQCSSLMHSNDSYRYTLCDGVCNPECRTLKYDLRLSGVQNLYPKNYKRSKEEDLRSGFTLAFSSATVEVYKLVPAMNVEMLFGILASFVGVWLGAAFVDITSFIDTSTDLESKKI